VLGQHITFERLVIDQIEQLLGGVDSSAELEVIRYAA